MNLTILEDGFRPFFLGAAAVAAGQVLLWLSFLTGAISLPVDWSPVLWHGHELVYGFASALIAGFLLTAVPNWAGVRFASPGLILSLFLLWLIPRVGMYIAALPFSWMQALSAAFFPILALVVAIPIIGGRDSRNYKVVLILAALATTGILLHLQPSINTLRIATDFLLILMLVIGARVIPFFTGRRLPAAGVSNSLLLSFMVPTTAVVALALAWWLPNSPPLALLNLVAGGLIFLQLAQWKPWTTFREPMLWILHLGFAWIGIAFLMRGFGAAASVATHAVTVGALGCLAIGMMTRVALGHSGRDLRADAFMVAAFIMVALAAVPRLVYALLPFNEGRVALMVSGFLWAFGFLIYLIRFTPIMFTPRK